MAPQRSWNQSQIVKVPIFAVMRDRLAPMGQRPVESVLRLGVAFVGLLDAQPDQSHFRRDPARGAHLQPTLSQVVEHPDLLDDSPRLIVGQHDSHNPEPHPPGDRCQGGDQQVRRWAVARTKMMLAEKYPFEAILLGSDPSLPIVSEVSGDLHRRDALPRVRDKYAGINRRAKKLKKPRLDHRSTHRDASSQSQSSRS